MPSPPVVLPSRAAALAVVAVLTGCAYGGSGSPAPHYLQYDAALPRGNTVTVCSGYGCQMKTPFTFTHGDIAEMSAIMDAARGDGSAAAERQALKPLIGWVEKRVGRETGTWRDRASIDIGGSNDRSQMDCVDEATNTTSYLTVLSAHGILRHHEVIKPMVKDSLLSGQWTHYFAVVRDKGTGQRWAVDSSMYPNGHEPIIMEAEKWYIRT